MTPEERKTRTEAFLQSKEIPLNPGLPCVESEDETEPRTDEEVAIRMFCLFSVIGTAYHWTDESYRQYLQRTGLWAHLSPEELAFMTSPTLDQQTAIDLTWRCEAMFVLMWSLHLFHDLPLPIEQINNDLMIDKFPSFDKDPWSFIRSLRLRPLARLLDASDLIYRLNWAARQAFVEGKQPPAGLDPRILDQWHYAINWITGFEDLPWDEVTTDT